MNEQEIVRLAYRVMLDAGLKRWSVKMDNATNRFGQCVYSKRTLSFSRVLLTQQTCEQVLDTIYHEVAHALVGGRHKHDAVWKECAIRLGGSGSTTGDESGLKIDYRYVGTCPNGHTTNRQRLTARAYRVSCGQCQDSYNPKLKFEWTRA